MPALFVKKEDKVLDLSGKDRGKTGRVLRVMPAAQRVLVEGVAFVKRHTRPNPAKNIKGGIVERESSVHVSNLKVICSECGEPTRVGHSVLEDGKKVRVCKKCKGILDK
ncbi:MAG: 50S ribosomal protein L24 [Acidobacteria bacterium]|nr:MAG: 50S ribosomal protein L24 [Acidobacteriota bacterium]